MTNKKNDKQSINGVQYISGVSFFNVRFDKLFGSALNA